MDESPYKDDHCKSTKWTDYPTRMITSYRDDNLSPQDGRVQMKSTKWTDHLNGVIILSTKWTNHQNSENDYQSTKWTDH